MGKKDTVTKEYMRNPVIFADAFNKYLYAGEQRIQPEQLQELDTTEIALPYGADKKILPEQKYRDVLKVLTAMTDGTTAYCMMGIENQSHIHYAMPVKNGVYDFLQLAHQVSEAAKEHREKLKKTGRSKKQEMSGALEPEEKPSEDEYLSGFWKTDKLVPVITLVVYFGAEEWNAPLSLREMYCHSDAEILRYTADYHVNLLAPRGMSDEEIEQFHTSLREIMLYIRYSKDKQKLKEVITTHEGFKHVERQAVDVINMVTGSEIKYEEGEERVDMCQAIAEMRDESRLEGERIGKIEGERIGKIKGAIEMCSEFGISLSETIQRISNRFNIPEDESDAVVRKYWK